MTELDRLCRSLPGFIEFSIFAEKHDVEVVSLKEKYDTTTPQGKLFARLVMSFAEFEREQTAERTRESVIARSERGLWTGGQLLGYDLDSDRKGYLTPNIEEAATVNFAHDSYLECGSMAETERTLNRNGFRSKSFTARTGNYHAGRKFRISTVQTILKNVAYIGQKTVPAGGVTGEGPTMCDAVWQPIVDEAKFWRVQELMAQNARSNRNGAKSVRHSYDLSGVLTDGRATHFWDSKGILEEFRATRQYPQGLRTKGTQTSGRLQ